MRYPVTILLLTCIILTASAQEEENIVNEHHYFVGLSLGASFPMGKFANKSMPDTSSGLAKAGPAGTLSLGYFFTRNIGFFFELSEQHNTQDRSVFNPYLEKNFGDSIRTIGYTSSWRVARLSGGPVFNIPVSASEKVALRVKLMAGILNGIKPNYGFQISFPTSSSISLFTQPHLALPTSFCYEADAGIRIAVAESLFLVVDAGYFYAPLRYHYDFYLPLPGGGTTITGRFSLPISDVHVMTGLEYKF